MIKKPLSTTISENTHELLREIATSLGVSVGSLNKIALQLLLEQLDEKGIVEELVATGKVSKDAGRYGTIIPMTIKHEIKLRNFLTAVDTSENPAATWNEPVEAVEPMEYIPAAELPSRPSRAPQIIEEVYEQDDEMVQEEPVLDYAAIMASPTPPADPLARAIWTKYHRVMHLNSYWETVGRETAMAQLLQEKDEALQDILRQGLPLDEEKTAMASIHDTYLQENSQLYDYYEENEY